jgi:hypothetical protein
MRRVAKNSAARYHEPSMRMAYLRSETLAAVLAVVAGGGGCIISGADDDDNASAETGGPSSTTPVTMSESDPSVDPETESTSGSSGEGSESGGIPSECGNNLLEDPGFEDGSPSEVWTESSEVFETPLCDQNCTEDDGAAPYAGDWWVWFGGVEQMDAASVSQTVVDVPAGPALIQFRFWINTGSGTGDDEFFVSIDDDEVFTVSDLDEGMYDAYTLVEVEHEFEEAGDHVVSFGARIAGDGLSNFFLDNVVLVSCAEGGGSTSSSTTENMTMTATDTDTYTDTDTDTDTATSDPTGSGTADDTAGTAASG